MIPLRALLFALAAGLAGLQPAWCAPQQDNGYTLVAPPLFVDETSQPQRPTMQSQCFFQTSNNMHHVWLLLDDQWEPFCKWETVYQPILDHCYAAGVRAAVGLDWPSWRCRLCFLPMRVYPREGSTASAGDLQCVLDALQRFAVANALPPPKCGKFLIPPRPLDPSSWLD